MCSDPIYSDIGVLIEQNFDSNNDVSPQAMIQEADSSIKQAILDSHNYYRSQTALGKTPNYPAATNMESLIWDNALASVAQAYADQCIWTHNANRKTQFFNTSGKAMWYDSTDIGVGENLYAYSGAPSTL